MGISGNMRANGEASNASTGLNAGHKLNKVVKIYNKALRMLDKIHDAYERVQEIYDLLNFDPSDIADLRDALLSGGIARAVNQLPSRVAETELRVPSSILNKLRKCGQSRIR